MARDEVNTVAIETPAERLRTARERAGFESAASAARANEWPVSAYRHHENGTRNIPVKVADQYARAYGVSVSWLLGLTDRDKRSYAEELQSSLYTDDEAKVNKEHDKHIAQKYGIALLHSAKLSSLPTAKSVALDQKLFALDISILEQVAPGRSDTPLTFMAVQVDVRVDASGVSEGAVLIVDRAAARIRRQGTLVLYTYAGEPGVSRLFRHPDETLELLNAFEGTSLRVASRDLLIWGTVIWIGQPS